MHLHRFRAVIFACVVSLALRDMHGTGAAQPAVDKGQGDDGGGAPVLRLDATRANLGDQWIGEPVVHAFLVRNDGAGALEIGDIETPRDVRVDLSPPGPIAPGATAKLNATLDTSELRSGAFEKSFTFSTNDPARPSVTVTLAGKYRHYIEVTPYVAGFGRLDGDGHRERQLTIRNHAPQAVEISLDPASVDGAFRCQLIETSPGRIWRLFIDTRPPFAPGPHRSEIRLKSSHPAQPVVTIGVYAIMPERIEVLPRMISLSAGEHPERVAVLGITNHGDKPVKVVGGSCSDPRVGVTIHEVGEGLKYRAVITFPPDYSPPESGADVLLKTNDGEIPVVSIPIGRATRRTTVARTAKRQPTEKSRRPKRRPVLDMIGKRAPVYSLESIEGAPVTNVELEFHPATILNFFAPNCPHCKRQIPKVEQLRQRYEPKGVRFVNVSEKMRREFTPDEVLSVVTGLGANLELAIDAGNKIGHRFKATGYPCLFILRSDGVIDHVVSGNKRDLVESVTGRLDSLLAAREGASAPSATP